MKLMVQPMSPCRKWLPTSRASTTATNTTNSAAPTAATCTTSVRLRALRRSSQVTLTAPSTGKPGHGLQRRQRVEHRIHLGHRVGGSAAGTQAEHKHANQQQQAWRRYRRGERRRRVHDREIDLIGLANGLAQLRCLELLQQGRIALLQHVVVARQLRQLGFDLRHRGHFGPHRTDARRALGNLPADGRQIHIDLIALQSDLLVHGIRHQAPALGHVRDSHLRHFLAALRTKQLQVLLERNDLRVLGRIDPQQLVQARLRRKNGRVQCVAAGRLTAARVQPAPNWLARIAFRPPTARSAAGVGSPARFAAISDVCSEVISACTLPM